MDPMEPILGSFIYPDIPQKGAQFQARVRHLRTPNKVNTLIQERQYLIFLYFYCHCCFVVFSNNYIFKQVELKLAVLKLLSVTNCHSCS